MGYAVDRLAGRPVYGNVLAPQQIRHAARMVAMVMSQENGLQRCILALQVRQYRGGIAGVDRGDMASLPDQPDIIVLEGAQGKNVHGAIL